MRIKKLVSRVLNKRNKQETLSIKKKMLKELGLTTDEFLNLDLKWPLHRR